MKYDFDCVIDRKIPIRLNSISLVSWQAGGCSAALGCRYGFPGSVEVIEALKRTADHGIFGYKRSQRGLFYRRCLNGFVSASIGISRMKHW
jgi:hypothetical protein